MTREQVVKSVVSYLNLQGEPVTAKSVDSVVVATLEVIESAMAQGQSIELRGFGRFSGRYVRARTYAHPRRSDIQVTVPSHLQPRFVPSRKLRDRINSQPRHS